MGLYPVAVCYSERQDNTIQYNSIQYNNISHKKHTTLKTTHFVQNQE
jgi:hypothetical protein